MWSIIAKILLSLFLVMSRGSYKNKKTSTLRHGLGDLPPHMGAKVEMITEEVLGFTNEYICNIFC